MAYLGINNAHLELYYFKIELGAKFLLKQQLGENMSAAGLPSYRMSQEPVVYVGDKDKYEFFFIQTITSETSSSGATLDGVIHKIWCIHYKKIEEKDENRSLRSILSGEPPDQIQWQRTRTYTKIEVECTPEVGDKFIYPLSDNNERNYENLLDDLKYLEEARVDHITTLGEKVFVQLRHI